MLLKAGFEPPTLVSEESTLPFLQFGHSSIEKKSYFTINEIKARGTKCCEQYTYKNTPFSSFDDCHLMV